MPCFHFSSSRVSKSSGLQGVLQKLHRTSKTHDALTGFEDQTALRRDTPAGARQRRNGRTRHFGCAAGTGAATNPPHAASMRDWAAVVRWDVGWLRSTVDPSSERPRPPSQSRAHWHHDTIAHRHALSGLAYVSPELVRPPAAPEPPGSDTTYHT